MRSSISQVWETGCELATQTRLRPVACATIAVVHKTFRDRVTPQHSASRSRDFQPVIRNDPASIGSLPYPSSCLMEKLILQTLHQIRIRSRSNLQPCTKS